MDLLDVIIWSTIWGTMTASMVHDYRYSKGEVKRTFFHWVGPNASPLFYWAGQMKKIDEAQAKANERRKRNRR